MSTQERSGVIAVDKPVGPTSHDIVAAARRALRTRRIGHTGTLDPFASGLLLLCVGNATRIAEYLNELPKTYVATARLGAATTTDDHQGDVIEANDAWRDLDAQTIESALLGMVGIVNQVPPAFSAKKIDGERMYERARRGEQVELAPVQVTIHSIGDVEVQLPDVRFTVECSSGTYVRAIARDLGRALGTTAHLTALRRTRIGTFDVTNALTPEQLSDDALVETALHSALSAICHMDCVRVSDEDAASLRFGRPIGLSQPLRADVPIVVEHAGELLAIAVVRDGMLQPKKVFTP